MSFDNPLKNVPDHIRRRAGDRPVHVGRWEPEHVRHPENASEIDEQTRRLYAAYHKILNCFEKTRSDDEIRKLLLEESEAFRKYKTIYPLIFEKVTNRDFSRDQTLMGMLYTQIYSLSRVQANEVELEAARDAVVNLCRAQLSQRMRNAASRGTSNPGEATEKPDGGDAPPDGGDAPPAGAQEYDAPSGGEKSGD